MHAACQICHAAMHALVTLKICQMLQFMTCGLRVVSASGNVCNRTMYVHLPPPPGCGGEVGGTNRALNCRNGHRVLLQLTVIADRSC